MSTSQPVDTGTLIENLASRDVPYFLTHLSRGESERISDEELISGLVQNNAERVQMSLIPLFLRHPELGKIVPAVDAELPTSCQALLKLYYTAAVVLQSVFSEELCKLLGPSSHLMDWYSKEFDIHTDTAEGRLALLAMRHADLTGLDINWFGTYLHAAKRFIRQLHSRARWNQPSV